MKEYKIVDGKDFKIIEEKMNELAKDGWYYEDSTQVTTNAGWTHLTVIMSKEKDCIKSSRLFNTIDDDSSFFSSRAESDNSYSFTLESENSSDGNKSLKDMSVSNIKYSDSTTLDVNPLSKGLYDDVKCPHCGAKHFSIDYCISTAIYCPTIIKEGKVVNTDTNRASHHCTCKNCGKEFSF